VHGDQRFGDLRQDAQRDAPAADVRPRPAVGAEVPGDDQGSVLVEPAAGGLDQGGERLPRAGLAPGRTGPAVDAGRAADLDRGPLTPGPHLAGLTPSATDEPQRGDHHRLARAGLSGHHGEARVRLDHGLVDHPEVHNAQLLQHMFDDSGFERMCGRP
jgi:hypothetical protein